LARLLLSESELQTVDVLMQKAFTSRVNKKVAVQSAGSVPHEKIAVTTPDCTFEAEMLGAEVAIILSCI